MKLNAEVGSARRADIPGYFIGGKTGTSEKIVNGRYSSDKVLTAFMVVAPADRPKYLFLTILDEPKALPETHGFRTSRRDASKSVPEHGRGSRLGVRQICSATTTRDVDTIPWGRIGEKHHD
ncbi:penicillin-binding transpeptidase domain-containing protein [Manganibacter manganicus]|uniref:Penicillin-binding protein transpeptidase domain-containing protein n=1 Tax=Manganibacter manganicus TaxID=1873176 RepID=A0A1V8RR05_9HYPH|nr:hypothetical protein BFN67_16820 [Pseudaminobacter manganicus]